MHDTNRTTIISVHGPHGTRHATASNGSPSTRPLDDHGHVREARFDARTVGWGVVVGLVIEGDRPSKRALQRWAAERLPSASVPRRWYAVAELPRTGGGKVRRDETLRLVSTERDVVRL